FDGAVNHQQKSIGLHGLLVLKDAVAGNTGAMERGAQRAKPANHDGAFDGGNDHRREITEHHDLADGGHRERDTASEQAPEAAPKGNALAPELDPASGIVKSNGFILLSSARAIIPKRKPLDF